MGESIQDFAINMNMIPPYNLKAYHSVNEILHDAYENAAEFSMNNAANEVRELSKCQHDLICDCEVSLDGTWQKRGGHASGRIQSILNGKPRIKRNAR